MPPVAENDNRWVSRLPLQCGAESHKVTWLSWGVKGSDVLLFKILGLEINFLCCTAIGGNVLKKIGIRKRGKSNWGRVQRQQVEKGSRVKTESSAVWMGEGVFLFWCEHDSRHLIKIWCDEYMKQDAFLQLLPIWCLQFLNMLSFQPPGCAHYALISW